ncbi:MAG: sterol desaturase family protein [Ginsengibacter sp.]
MHLDTTLLYKIFPALLVFMIAETAYLVKTHRHDYKDMLSSFSLLFGILPVSLFTSGIILFTYTWLYQFRLFTMPTEKWWVWVFLFFGDDFSYYWYHRLSHQVRFLWASHVVHHSSEKFTLSSGLRVPWTSNLTGSFLFWAWMPFIGFEPYLVIFMKSASIIYQFWMHTETIGKLPGWYEKLFNTPSHHRVHHASNIEYLDKNHAGTLIIWDKMFGTYQEEITKPVYGLAGSISSHNPFVIAFSEWGKIARDLKRAKKIRYCLQYLLNPPGWSHDGSANTTKQLQEVLKNKNHCSLLKQIK